jgi:hypothetical protein
MREVRKIITDMDVVTEADFESANWGDAVTSKIPEGKTKNDLVEDFAWVESEYLQPKFDSVAAFKLHRWTLDSGQSEDHGNAVDWHRWSAIFRNVTDSGSPRKSEQPAAMLHVDSQGFVSAEWYSDGGAAEEVWASLVKEWDEFESAEEAEV